MLFYTNGLENGVNKDYVDEQISKIKLKQGTPGLDSRNIEIRKNEQNLEWRYSTELSNLIDFESDFVKCIVNKEDTVKKLLIVNNLSNAKYVQIKTITVNGIDEEGNLVASLDFTYDTISDNKSFPCFGGFDPTRGEIQLISNTEIDSNMSIQNVINNVVSQFNDDKVVDISEITLNVYLLDPEMTELKQVKLSYIINKTSNNNWNTLVSLSDLKGEQGKVGKTGTSGVNGREVELKTNNDKLEYRYCTNITPFVNYESDFTQIEVNAEDTITRLIFKDLLPKKYKYIQIKIATVFGETEEGTSYNANMSAETAPEGVSFPCFGGFDPTIGDIELVKPELEGNMIINNILNDKDNIFGSLPITKITKVILWLSFLNEEKELQTETKAIFVVKSQSEEDTTNPWKEIYDLSTLQGEEGKGWLFGMNEPITEGREGDLYLRTTTFDIYKKKQLGWELIGNIKGATGETGETGKDGREIEIQKGETHIQWRYIGQEEWVNIVSLEEIRGEKADTSEIEALKQKIQELEDKIESVKLEWEDNLLL